MMIQGQGSRAKGQSVMEESGESSKGKTPSLEETRASRVTFEKPPEEQASEASIHQSSHRWKAGVVSLGGQWSRSECHSE